MATPPDKPRKIRTFVALDLPADIRARLAAWGARELRDEALRPIAEGSLHVTLCFLGHIPEEDVERAAAIVTGLRPRPVAMTLRAEPVAKPKGRPGLFAIHVDSPAAAELQEELSKALVGAGLYEPEKRPFWPHLTVARVRTERGRKRRPRRVRKRPGELPQALVHTFGSVRASLYRSNLRPDGARYESLANLDLPPVE
jgi:RNA 2',3'-cyclic 3'-phosphodiesterase